MYFPTTAARQLSTAPALPLPSELVISLSVSPGRNFFCTLTKTSLSLWRVRPTAVLAHLARTPTSIVEHGENVAMYWAPDGAKVIIQTTFSFLVLVTVSLEPSERPYQSPQLAPSAARHFLPGPGEAILMHSIGLRLDGVMRMEGTVLSVSPRRNYIIYSTKSPPSVQRIPWPQMQTHDEDVHHPRDVGRYDSWVLNDQELPFLVDPDVIITKITYHRVPGFETWITSDGRVYVVQLIESETERPDSTHLPNGVLQPVWQGTCIHNVEPPRWVQKQRQRDPDEPEDETSYQDPRRAMVVAVNTKFSMFATGTYSGTVEFTNFPSEDGHVPKSRVLQIPSMYARDGTGPVCTMEWSSDGYVLAVGLQKGWVIWSVGGWCLAWGFGGEAEIDEDRFQDAFMFGVRDLFWAPGNLELFTLARSSPNKVHGQLFAIPFAKSATTGQLSPDNVQYAFLQLDDRVLVYRGADQPDMSVINPEADVWQHIKIPQSYLAANWPIRYSCLSVDGRFIAVAGRRGLVHYSSTSGRWKLFADELQEQAFTVKGGLLWFHHVLIAAVDVQNTYQIRLYSRDLELSNQNVLHREVLSAPVVILSLVDNSVLVYTADNTLYHYLIVPTADAIMLHLCGSISFSGIIAAPSAVRVLSWMIPSGQKELGNPVNDLAVATVLMVVGGKLVLLRPRKSGEGEVNYDMQIFADRVEFCWTHLHGIGTLENSLWAYDGQGIRVWLDALTIDTSTAADSADDALESVKESVNIPLTFYPLSVLMDKGIIIGAEQESATRLSLPFVMFRDVTSTHLFLHHILLFHLRNGQVKEAVSFASHYQHLVFFSHALEILLHNVVEEDAEHSHEDTTSDNHGRGGESVLPYTVEFLDHFDASLDVVVGCARKIEMSRWPRLFDIVGDPKDLFETCLVSNRLRTAGSYLLVLHNLEQIDGVQGGAIRLLKSAVTAKDWQLCRELLRFLHSIDDSGQVLSTALAETAILDLPESVGLKTNGSGHGPISA